VSHFRDHITNAKALDIKVLVCFFLFLGHIARTECKDVASCYSCSMGQSVCVCVCLSIGHNIHVGARNHLLFGVGPDPSRGNCDFFLGTFPLF